MEYKKIFFVLPETRFKFQTDDRYYKKQIDIIWNYGFKLGIFHSTSSYEIIETLLDYKLLPGGSLILDPRIGCINKDLLSILIQNGVIIDAQKNKLAYIKGQKKYKKEIVLDYSFCNPWNILNSFINNKVSFISPSAKILPGANLTGKNYIGENVLVGNNTLIRNSYIDNGAVIGFGTEINQSYIGRNTTLHTNFVGNSLIGDECHFGYISCTTTLRLDEKQINLKWLNDSYPTSSVKCGSFLERRCSLGAHVTLMPGVVLGENSIIEPYCLIKNDVSRNKYCRSCVKVKLKPLRKKRTVENYVGLRKNLDWEIKENY